MNLVLARSAKHSLHPSSFILHPFLLCSALALCWALTGCDNQPFPRFQGGIRPDGKPWKTTYRALPDEPRSLDPQVSYDVIGTAVVALIDEGLLEYHPFKSDPCELRPCIAETMPERTQNADGTETYTFHLKKGIFFQDDPCFPDGKGREMRAEDFVYAFKRITDPKSECPVSSDFQANIIGMAEAYAQARKAGRFDYDAPLEGVIAADRYTLQLVLKKPNPQILYWLAMQFTVPVPREAVEYYDGGVHDGVPREQFKFHPVGTGPFRLVEWKRRSVIRLVRNEHYHTTTFPEGGWSAEEDARFHRYIGASLPQVDEVQFAIIREAIPHWVLFKQGFLDSYVVSKDVFNSVLSASHALTPEYAARGVRLSKQVDPSTFYFLFNMDDPVVGKNQKLRQAIGMVYDEELAREIFSNGVDVNAQQLLPPGIFGYNPHARHPWKQHDLELARKLVAEAGYPGGIDPKTDKPLELQMALTADSAGARQKAEFEKRQIEQLGIRVRVIENTWEKQQEAMDRGAYQVTATAWYMGYPDPENLFMLFYGKNFPPKGNNTSRYHNPEFDLLYERMRNLDNTPERLAMIRRMSQILEEDCPMIPLFHNVAYALNQPWAPQFASNMFLNNGPKYVDVDVPLREAKLAQWNRRTYAPLWTGLALLGLCVGYGLKWARRHDG